MATDFKSFYGELAQQPEPSWDDVTEAAYRRGFSHGVNEIVQAIASQLSAEAKELLLQYERRIREWRRQGGRGFPPSIPRLPIPDSAWTVEVPESWKKGERTP